MSVAHTIDEIPERPETATTAVILNRDLAGKTLLNLYIAPQSRYAKTGTFAGMHYLTQNMEIMCISSRGKKMIIALKRSDGVIIYLVSFFGMEGRWLYKPENHVSIILEVATIRKLRNHTIISDRRTISYCDARRFGILEAVATQAEYDHVFKEVGPDLLYDQISVQDYAASIRGPRLAKKEICTWMLNQKYFSGVGNYLRAEILYESKVAPQRHLDTLTDQEIILLHANTIRIIRESFEKGGLTIATYRAPDGGIGTYNHKVYSKDRDPIGNPIVQYKCPEKRTVWWVPNIQV